MEETKTEDVKNIRKENTSRDKIAIQTLIRITALERALLKKGILSEEDLANEAAQAASELVNRIKKETSVEEMDA